MAINHLQNLQSLNIPDVLEKYRPAIETTLRPILSISTHPTSTTLPIEASKLGGFPYWPQSKALPLIENSDPKLVAQINLSELKAQGLTLPDFPQTGILQFFYAVGDDMSGLRFDQPQEPDFNTIKVVYHADTTELPSQDERLFSAMNNHEGMPYEGELELQFTDSLEYLGLSDNYQQERQYASLGEFTDEESDTFFDNIENSGSKMGGYAYFTQDDPRPYLQIDGITESERVNNNPDEEWVLLLQLDSDDNLMWGDSGVANWFIRRKDLKALDFSKVLFNWDCC